MNYLFKNEIIDYDFINNKSNDTILFLHGWGGDKFSFKNSMNLLKLKYNILTISIPTIIPTTSVWDIYDYTELVYQIILLHSITNLIVICHSFGFRIATILNTKLKFKKLIITGGAGPKKIKKLSQIQKINAILLLKLKKYKFLYKTTASKDYISLSKINKKTFKNIVNFNSINFMKFDCPILAFWGKSDLETPLWILNHIKRNNNVKSVTVDSGHFAYITHSEQFNHEIIRFLK